MAHGADPRLKKPGKYSALELAQSYDNDEMVNMLSGWLGVYDPDERIMQQLALMIKTDREDQVKVIMNKGVDMDAKFEMVPSQMCLKK